MDLKRIKSHNKHRLIVAVIAIVTALTLLIGCGKSREYAVDSRENDKLSEFDSVDNGSGRQNDEQGGNTELSASCDAVLSEGTDVDGDYYELVATQEDTYNSTVIKIGVIKNNKWLVELSTDSPFIDKESGLLWWYDYYGYSYHYSTTGLKEYNKNYSFIGNGCFYFCGTFYNADTQKYYKDDYVDNGSGNPNDYFFPYKHYENDTTKTNKKKSDVENVILEVRKDDKYVYELLNTTTMTKTVIGGNNDFLVKAPFSEGLFLGSSQNNETNTVQYAFYNSKGEIAIDLSEYNIVFDFIDLIDEKYRDRDGVFINGKAIITVVNDVGKYFRLTIDKNGNMISQELVDI